jgi:2-dehydro-3-deoxygluconokinase
MNVVTFGEVMARVAPPGFLRFRQALPGSLEVTFAGAEANVAVSLAMLGMPTAFVSALPSHSIADACVDRLRGLGVDTRAILRTEAGRLGIYFLETGANQRPSRVIYDREHSAVALTRASAYDWKAIFDGAGWFHVTGITPALSLLAAETALHAVREAKSRGLTVSCDLNFRKNLWRWEKGLSASKLAEKTMRQMLPHVDLVIANEEDCGDVLGIRAAGTDVEAGQLDVSRYPLVARQLVEQFPNVRHVGITLRESISASHNNWGTMLYCTAGDQAYFAPLEQGQYRPYPIRNIVDRVGAGDSFGAALIFALNTPELGAPQTAVAFATAASCLAHSISGDFNFSSRAEIETLMHGSSSGRVVR